jgi:hypothetical protein
MLPICPKCGKKVLYISPPGIRDNKVYIVDAEEKQLISKMGRVLTGYPEHICTMPDKTAEVTSDGSGKNRRETPGQ